MRFSARENRATAAPARLHPSDLRRAQLPRPRALAPLGDREAYPAETRYPDPEAYSPFPRAYIPYFEADTPYSEADVPAPRHAEAYHADPRLPRLPPERRAAAAASDPRLQRDDRDALTALALLTLAALVVVALVSGIVVWRSGGTPSGQGDSLIARGDTFFADRPSVQDTFAARWPATDLPVLAARGRPPASAKDRREPIVAAQAPPATAPLVRAPAAAPRQAIVADASPASPWQPAASTNGLGAPMSAPPAKDAGRPAAAPAPETPRTQVARESADPPQIPLPPMPPPAAPAPSAQTTLASFATAPFPDAGRNYSDDRVLLHLPRGFDINKPAVMVVFFHGHGALLERDVMARQKLPQQISASGMNAVLVAPQFATDAADSNPGKFRQPGAFARFLKEAGRHLAELYGAPTKAQQFANLPVVIVAYSGGYLAAGLCIQNGNIGKRLHGVVLLDAMYGELGEFAHWIENAPSAFLVSAYTQSTRRRNMEFARLLEEKGVRYSTDVSDHLWRGRVALIATDGVRHRDFVTQAWTRNPIEDILTKLD